MGELPKAAQQQGCKNAFFTGLIVLPIMGLIWLLVWLVVIFGFGQSGETGLYFTLLTWVTIALAYYLYMRLKNTKNAGAILLDIMPFPKRNTSLFGGGLGLISILFGMARYLFDDTGKSSGLFFMGFGLFFAVFQIAMGLSHLQIREKGFWIYGDLLTWNKIESLDWIDDGGKTISLRLLIRGKMPSFLRNGVLPIPIDKKEQVAKLIGIHLPNVAPSGNRAHRLTAVSRDEQKDE